MILSVKDLSVSYGNINAVNGITFDVTEGQIVTLIGANGAGKTTLLRAVSGLIPYEGTVSFSGINLKGKTPHEIISGGITHVPEGRAIFGTLTVMENLELSAWVVKDKGIYRERLRHIFSLFPKLEERKKQLSGTLSGGEQQMLAIGRAIMTGGSLMLLDEPSMGLSPLLVKEIFKVILDINKSGKTILLVEQNANMALHIANYGYVLETGKIVFHGSKEVLSGNPKIREAYLGV
ncbi:MAG: ABC transporter ATP-binding protein [Nitrospirae bacterium]|nr:ABC transporter ATP-binding protein [Nitrospirota bacterium]